MSPPARDPQSGIAGKANVAGRRHAVLNLPPNFEEAARK